MVERDAMMDAARIDTALALHDRILDLIDQCVRLHGAHDPHLHNLLCAALVVVAEKMQAKFDPHFMFRLSETIRRHPKYSG